MERRTRALVRLIEIIDALRGPNGCPWDRTRTLSDMGRYLLEEVAESIDAVEDSGGKPTRQVSEELGDVLMNVFLSARIAEDEGGFDIADVAACISEKLVRRHPHVFGGRKVAGVNDVVTNWNAIKEEENKEKKEEKEKEEKNTEKNAAEDPPGHRSILDDVPRSLPPLERAHELSQRAARVGFDWPDSRGALDKVIEEAAEVRALLDDPSEGSRARLEAELGDLLFAAANLCRKLNVSPDAALRRTLKKFCERFRAIEDRYPEIEKATLEEMESVWQETKGPCAPAEPPLPGSTAPGSTAP